MNAPGGTHRGESSPRAGDACGDACRLYEAKIRAELSDADAAAGASSPSWAGDPLSGVVVVKGEPGSAEASGEEPFSGPDGEALRKALDALGMPGGFLGLYVGGGASGDSRDAEERLALQLAAVDPATIVAADGAAAKLLSRALGVKTPPSGRAVDAGGARLVALDGFEAALADEAAKKRVWLQLRSLKPKPAGGGSSGKDA